MSKRTTFLLGIGVIATLLFGLQVAAYGVHNEGVFELDGDATNQAAKAGDDWDNICREVTGTNCSTTTGAPNATAEAWEAETDRSASIFTGGGSKDPNDINQWAWKNGGGLPDKDNLLHAFAARYTANGEELLYFGSDRFDNSGDAVQGFWFFQDEVGLGTNPVGGGTGFTGLHETGDLLVLSDFSNGGGTSTIAVYEWDARCNSAGQVLDPDGPGGNPPLGTCGADNLLTLASSNSANCASPADDRFCGIVNANTIQMPWSFTDKSGTTVPDGPDPGTAPDPNGALNGEFFEGGVNLTDLGLGDRCFATVAAETRSSTSPTATLKDFITGEFGECEATVTTQSTPTGSNNSIGAGSVTTSDSATVSVTGASTWNGTVQFSLCGPSDSITNCNTGGTPIGSPVPVSNTTPTVTSDDAAVTKVGKYCWGASFVAENPADLDDEVDDGTNECFTVTPKQTALDTDAGDGPVDFGQPITDTATLSGTANQPANPVIQYPTTTPPTLGPPAGGTITFTLYKNNCTTLATGTGTNPQSVTVNGDGTYGPVSFTPDEPGTYHWKAEYTPASGDPNNLGSTHNDTCNDPDESVVVRQVQPTISTNQRWLPNDSATITANGGGNLSGTVRFRLYDNDTCFGTPLYDSNDANGDPTITVSGSSPQTVSSDNTTALTSSATVSWLVEYTSNNPAQTNVTSACNTEQSSLTIDNDTTD